MIDPRHLPPASSSLIRIDNRLVHGQILEAWVPFIGASHIVVVNDEVADDLFRGSVIRMAVPREIEMRVYSVEEFSRNLTYENYTGKKSIVLFSSIDDLLRAYRLGFRFDRLNIGNVHNGDCVCRPATSISLSENNVKDLMLLADSGVKIEIRCVPRDRPVDFLDALEEFGNSRHSQGI
ncbi:MAG: PTS sugar transporter subunit IIB [Deltaproteobacteria bacterium]|nr:PTS sugar transporter subunit IIB [Deltaproteobacteria bacterium]MBW2595771.1 PTS sugar transporter subunit IIB [Deltaproteobacteria bacterium]MBW2650871.1 PTS sugar transporter subunit IIB [Deltaproteobacteria bacterium]